MPSAFNVTAPTNDVQLSETRQGSVALTITNISGKPQQGRIAIAALDSTKATWLSVAGGTDRTFPVGGAQQVTIQIAVPNDAAPGHYTFRPDVVAVQNPDEDSTQGPTLAFEVPPPPPPPPPRKIPPWVFAAAAAVVVLIVGGVLAYLLYFTVIVPTVVNETVAVAQPTIVAAHLVVGTPTPRVNLSSASGTILEQSPSAQARVGRGSSVSLVVAQNAIVPKVVGLTQAQAQAAITGNGFAVGSTTFQSTLTTANGVVLNQNPAAGAVAAPGASINLVVERNVTVPSVIGANPQQAASALAGAGLNVGATTLQTTLNAPDGVVINQNPPSGTRVAPGAAVALIIERNVVVPSVIGQTYPTAFAILQGAGLSPVPAGTCPIFVGLPVRSESPPPGTRQPPGASVVLIC